MSLARIINRPCTIVRRVASEEKDELGNETTEPVKVETVCELQQQPGFRREDEGEVSDTRWTLFLLPGEEIGVGDAVQVSGAGEYEVFGEPWSARNPRTGQESHIEVAVRRTAGRDEAA